MVAVLHHRKIARRAAITKKDPLKTGKMPPLEPFKGGVLLFAKQMGGVAKMKIPILAVDRDMEVCAREQAGWQGQGVGIVRVDTMRQGIEELLHGAYLFVAINADNIPYLPLLPVMRESTVTPIFIVTSHFTIPEQVKALHAGADVYASFQSAVEENIVSALALLHRTSEQRTPSEKPAICRGIMVDVIRHEAYIDHHLLELTPLEFNILLYFVRNRGRALSKEQIYSHAWDEDNCLDVDGTVSFHVCNLRRKLAGHTGETYIETVWGVGFKLIDKIK